jgi:diguanylate cyclase (GGDEF)-like protein/PAS domain S-box-containing protein
MSGGPDVVRAGPAPTGAGDPRLDAVPTVGTRLGPEALGGAARDRTLLELGHDLVWDLDGAGRIRHLNGRAGRVLGHADAAVRGRPLSALVADGDRPILSAVLADPAPERRGPHELAFVTAAGGVAWLRVTVRHVVDVYGDRTGSLVVASDVTDLRAASGALRLSEARLRDVLSTIPVGVVVYDAAGRAEFANEAACRVLGRPVEELCNWGLAFVHPDDRDRIMAEGVEAAARGLTAWSEVRFLRPDGTVVWLSVSTVIRSDAEPGDGGSLTVFNDVTARKEAEVERDRFFESAIELQCVVSFDGHRLLRANPAFERAFGWTADELRSVPYFRFLHPEDLVQVGLHLDGLGAGGAASFEARARTRDGDWRWIAWTTVADVDRQVLYVSGRDVTTQKSHQDDLSHRAFHDVLTGLANRGRFVQRLERSLRRLRHQPDSTAVAVLFLDLDGFKGVNDSLGHAAGDELLLAIARRLESAVRPSDIVARYGGDEFVVLCDSVADVDQVTKLAQRLTNVMVEPFTVRGRPLYVSASVGVTVAEAGRETTPAELLSEADTAAYRAKENGKARFELYDSELRSRAEERLAVEGALRQAEPSALQVEYRPMVDLRSARVVAVEAGLRWEHPSWGRVAPERYAGVAEDTGLSIRIGTHVLEQACRQAQEWHAAGGPPFWIMVPVSPRQFGQPDFVDVVRRVLDEAGPPAGLVCLEIGETAIVRDLAAATRRLGALRGLGVRLAVDDFGAGLSSLNDLRRLPVDLVNVDRSFVYELGSDPAGSAIVAAVVNLAHLHGLQVVAEGVETVEHLAALVNLACDLGHGSFFGDPVDASGARRLLGR